jgi:hypothetical protein
MAPNCMKYLRFALVVFASAVGIVRAQDDERRAPPTEIPDFSNLDEYIYEPKSSVTLGFRHLSGAKTTFSGRGSVPAPEDPGPTTGANLFRLYHDGSVEPDTRIAPQFDPAGNPVLDNNSQVFAPITPDGKTNTWSFGDARQLSEANGYVAFHSYSADITDTGIRSRDADATNGLELAVTRDMGKLFGSRLSWNLTAGMSINDITAAKTDQVDATITTRRDYYSLFGQTPPEPPYAASSAVDSPVLLANEPALSLTTTSNGTVENRWKLKGSYFTFRAGPTIWIPFSSRFRLSISVGGALVYAGTSYSVVETFTPEIGADIVESSSSVENKLLPAYYADASLQFDLTERAGFYAGAVFQSAGSYDQTIESEKAHYATKIDLANQNGLRAGMSIRF